MADEIVPCGGMLLPRFEPPASLNEDGELHGRLITAPVAGGKRLQACCLVLDSGVAVLLSYRPQPALFAYERKRVAIRGRFRNPALEHPERQAVSGWHLEIEGIRLLPGEEPYDPPPQQLPPPARLVTCAEVAACREPYARLVGRLLAAWMVDDTTASVRLQLEDAALEIGGLSTSHPSSVSLRMLLKPPTPRSRTLKPSTPARSHRAEPPLSLGDVVTVVVSLDGGVAHGLRLCPGERRCCED